MEKLRKFGRYSARVLNRSKHNEETGDFNFVTEFKEEQCSIIWRIENIHRCTLKCGEFFESPAFSTMFCSEVKWTLKIYPRGGKEYSEGQKVFLEGTGFDPIEHILLKGNKTVGIFINRISSCPVTSSYTCRFSYKRELLNNTSKQMSEYFSPKGSFIDIEMDSTNSSEYGTNNFFSTESLKPPQTLIVRCDIYASNAYHKGATGNYMPGMSKSCSLYKNLKEMHESGKFSDITLQVGDVQFPAHKAILASRSEVFDAMFKHDMKESKTNIVQVQGIDPTVFSSTLQYIYTGSVDDFNIEKAILLYSVADKYLLDELKNWCVDMMLANLTVENVCQIAVLAELHPDPKLRKATFNVFRNYTGDIFKRKEWQDLIQDSDRRALVSNILQAVSADFTTNFA